MIPHNLIKRIELPEGYKVLRSYFARAFDYGVIPHRSAKEAEERAQDDKLNSRLELRVVILDPTGTKTDIAILSWKPSIKVAVDEPEEEQANEVLS